MPCTPAERPTGRARSPGWTDGRTDGREGTYESGGGGVPERQTDRPQQPVASPSVCSFVRPARVPRSARSLGRWLIFFLPAAPPNRTDRHVPHRRRQAMKRKGSEPRSIKPRRRRYRHGQRESSVRACAPSLARQEGRKEAGGKEVREGEERERSGGRAMRKRRLACRPELNATQAGWLAGLVSRTS